MACKCGEKSIKVCSSYATEFGRLTGPCQICRHDEACHDDEPLPAATWNRAHTAAALANLANVVAKLEDRVAVLEAERKTLQNKVGWQLEKLQNLIESMEADS